MRSIPIEKGCYYHVFNRGNQKQQLFFDRSDYIRFLFLLVYFQSPQTFSHLDRQVSYYLNNGHFNISEKDIQKIAKNRFVDLINFCAVPNHTHLTLYNRKIDGIPLYMHRVSNAYGKYFNTKYDKTGHVFQGTYKAINITDDNYLSYLSAYIHRNPREIKKWRNKEHLYPWSSFGDYKENRWGILLKPEIILERYKDFEEYKQFVLESGAKEKPLTEKYFM
jgi:putative transposase